MRAMVCAMMGMLVVGESHSIVHAVCVAVCVRSGDVHRRVVVDEGASDHMLRLLHQDFVQQAAARRKTKKRRRPKPSDTHDTGVKHSRKS